MGEFQHYRYYQPLGAGGVSDAVVRAAVLPRPLPTLAVRSQSSASHAVSLKLDNAAQSLRVGMTGFRGRLNRKALLTTGAQAIGTGLAGYGVLHVAALTTTDQVCITYTAAVLLFGFDSRLSFVGALVALIEVPLLQHFGFLHYSDIAAVFAFYAFAAGVIMAVAEYYKEMRSLRGQKRPSDVAYRLYR